MKANHLLFIALGLVILAAAADLAWYYPKLPEKIATHFNGRGEADGWSSKTNFVVQQGFLLVCLPGLFVGIAWLLPRLPVSLINVPHREYWLSPARRAVTLELISRALLFFGLLMTVFLTGLMHLMLAANFSPKPRLGSALVALTVAQLAAAGGLVIWLVWRFRRPRA